jgi:hypothetical protein
MGAEVAKCCQWPFGGQDLGNAGNDPNAIGHASPKRLKRPESSRTLMLLHMYMC